MTSESATADAIWLNKLAKEKTSLLEDLFAMEPLHVPVKDPKTNQPRPRAQGEDIIALWDELYANDPMMKSIVVDTVIGPSTPNRDYYDAFQESKDATAGANPAMPYQQLRALVGDGGKWKWPEIWKTLDLLPRRGPAYRHPDDPSNLKGQIINPNPDIKVPLNCLVVGGGPVGLRLAIELLLGGHRVTIWEKRREAIDPETGKFNALGFTNRINRPHINNFCRNDLDRLNGRNFMTAKMCYPVFTNAHTSSIGIDELQMMLLKTALLLGVNFRLGVGYETAAVDIAAENRATSQRPSWLVTYTADDIAADRYDLDKSGTVKERFDALFGCDGGNSKVRKTQAEWLGEPQTKTYKKMFGIVSNLRKCSRAKLKEPGFSRGLEPEDKAGILTGAYFYKASYHNYFIVHPSKAEMEANGIPWKSIYSFDEVREGTEQAADQESNADQARLKAILKRYMTKKAKEMNIPIDTEAENGGFVSAPNDVMGFDFSQFYNCEKSAAVHVPPLDWDAEKDGEWEIHCPLVALVGDAVQDPNWLKGVGLQRGWNSAMDATFYADNLYNNISFNGQPPSIKDPIEAPIEWSQHLDNMMGLMQKLATASREGHLSSEMDTGTLDERGPVVLQIKRKLMARKIEPLIPPYVPHVEPWGRYKTFELDVKKNFKGKDLYENEHPFALRELAIFHQNERYLDRASRIRSSVTRPKASMLSWRKRFECSAFWGMMPLLKIDGKLATGAKKAETLAAPDDVDSIAGSRLDGKNTSTSMATKPPAVTFAPNAKEVKEIALMKSARLHETVVSVAMNGPTGQRHSTAEEAVGGMIFKKDLRNSIQEEKKNGIGGKQSPPPDEARETSILIEKLPKTLSQRDDATRSEKTESVILADLKRKALAYEKEALKLKLRSAQAQVVNLEANMKFARQEVDMIQQCLQAYEDAEEELNRILCGL